MNKIGVAAGLMTVALVTGSSASTASAHHSFAAFNVTTEKTISGTVKQVDKFGVQIIETRLAFESYFQILAQDALRDPDSALTLLRKQRIPEDEVRFAVTFVDVLNFRDDVFRAAGPIGSGDPVRTIRAELRTASTGKDRKRML